MLLLAFDIADSPVILAAAGEAGVKRLALLRDAGAERLSLYAPEDDEFRAAAGPPAHARLPDAGEIAQARFLFAAGLDDGASRSLAATARAHRLIVNVEDVKPLCEAYVPAMVRRGALAIAISTGGASPGLARRIKADIAGRFGPEWAARLEAVSRARDAWRAEGADVPELARRTDALIDANGWLG